MDTIKANNILNLSSLNENIQPLKIQFMKKFLDNFQKENTLDDGLMPDSEDYSFLLFLFLIWIKEYHNQIRIQTISPIHYKLFIQKSVKTDELISFLKMYEELTLKRLYYLNNDLLNEWIIELNF